MTTVSVVEMKARLSYYLNLVASGESITICKHNVPIAIITPIEAAKERVSPECEPDETRIGSIKRL